MPVAVQANRAAFAHRRGRGMTSAGRRKFDRLDEEQERCMVVAGIGGRELSDRNCRSPKPKPKPREKGWVGGELHQNNPRHGLFVRSGAVACVGTHGSQQAKVIVGFGSIARFDTLVVRRSRIGVPFQDTSETNRVRV